MSDPKQHATRRRLFAQAFSNSTIQTFEPAVREKVDLAVAKIKRDAEQDSADILKWFTFMATDVTGELSFGKSFEMLQHEQVSTMRSKAWDNCAPLTTFAEESIYPGSGDRYDDIRHAF